MLRWSDRTLLFSVRSDGIPASSRAKEKKEGSTGLWLCPISWDQTRPVLAPGELDLYGVDRTLGGSVRSLPPERRVNRKRAVSGFFSLFPFLSRVDHHITVVRATTYPASRTAPTSPLRPSRRVHSSPHRPTLMPAPQRPRPALVPDF